MKIDKRFAYIVSASAGMSAVSTHRIPHHTAAKHNVLALQHNSGDMKSSPGTTHRGKVFTVGSTLALNVGIQQHRAHPPVQHRVGRNTQSHCESNI